MSVLYTLHCSHNHQLWLESLKRKKSNRHNCFVLFTMLPSMLDIATERHTHLLAIRKLGFSAFKKIMLFSVVKRGIGFICMPLDKLYITLDKIKSGLVCTNVN